MSFSVRVLLLVLLAAAPIFAIQTERELERRAAREANVAQQAANLAALAAAQQERLVEGLRYAMTALSALPEVAGRDPEACSARMQEFHRRLPEFAWLGVVDRAGDLFCSSHPTDRPVNLSDRDYVQKAQAGGAFAVSAYLEGRITRQRQIAFALPAANGFAALAAINLDSLPGALEPEQIPAGAAVTFHDRNGVLLARAPPAPELIGRAAPSSILDAARNGSHVRGIGLDGKPRHWTTARLPAAPELFVAVGLPFAEADADAAGQFRRDMALVALAFALTGVAAATGAQFWLRRPLRRVQRALDRLGRGDLTARAEPLRRLPPELDGLVAGFNDMAVALETRDRRLRESERRLADIAANLPGVVFRRVLSPDGMLRYDYMSEGVRKLLGVDPERFSKPATLEQYSRRIAPDGREAWRAALLASARSLEPLDIEFRARTADGGLRWLRSIARPQRLEDGSVAWDGVTLDIADRKDAEEALRRSEARLRDVAEATADIIWETDENNRFTYFSDRLWSLPGVQRERVMGRERMELVAEAVPPSSVEEHLADLAARKPFRNFTYWANDAVGGRCFASSGRPVFSEAGEFRGYRGAGSDVTERVLAEGNRARLAAIVEASHDAIVSWSLDGVITSWNPEAERLYGYPAAEAMGGRLEMLVPPERRAGIAPVLAAVAQGEWFDQIETVRIRRDGRRIDVSLTISPVRDGSGRVIGGATIARDVTERRRAEARQRLLLAELDHRVKNMLAVLVAVFQTTAHKARSLEEFSQAFEGRLMALVRAHDALAQNKMEGAELRELALFELSMFCDPTSDRLRLDGERVLLTPKAAQTIGMALHELSTNASKHGALAAPGGRIELSWRLRPGAPDPILELVWRERGGPPVRPPSEKGFGLSLLERGVAYELGGEARLAFAAEGVVWEMSAPLRVADGGPQDPALDAGDVRANSRRA